MESDLKSCPSSAQCFHLPLSKSQGPYGDRRPFITWISPILMPVILFLIHHPPTPLTSGCSSNTQVYPYLRAFALAIPLSREQFLLIRRSITCYLSSFRSSLRSYFFSESFPDLPYTLCKISPYLTPTQHFLSPSRFTFLPSSLIAI